MTTETFNRTRKATRLADSITERAASIGITDRGLVLDAARRLTDEGWADVARTAGTGEASLETRSAVLAVLTERANPADPFGGLS